MVATYLPGALALLCVLLATFVLAGIGAGSGADEIRREEDVSHLWEARTRGAAIGGYVLCAYALLLWHRLAAPGWNWYVWLTPFAALLAAACLFGLRFDIRLNLRRLLDRFYLGQDKQTAATDKAVQARGMSGRTFARLKLLGTVVGAVLAVILSGCAGSREQVDNKKNARMHQEKSLPVFSKQAFPDFTQKKCTDASSPQLTANTLPDLSPAQVAQLPKSVQRQYRKNLKAQPPTGPKKLAKGSTYQSSTGNNNQQQSSGKKSEGPSTQAADSAVVNLATAGKYGQAAAGPGITQTRTEPVKPSLWQRVLSYWPWLALAGVGAVVWFFWPPILALLRRLV